MSPPRSSIAQINERLQALVPLPSSAKKGKDAATTSSAVVDQLFDLLAELAIGVRACQDPAEVKDEQRTIEDALLRVTCGGWAGPAVRRSASEVLSALFTVGKGKKERETRGRGRNRFLIAHGTPREQTFLDRRGRTVLLLFFFHRASVCACWCVCDGTTYSLGTRWRYIRA